MSSSPPDPTSPPPGLEDELPLAVDDDVSDTDEDDDSAYGSLAGDAISLDSSMMRFRQENGRSYHGWKPERGYILPSDKEERERLGESARTSRLPFPKRVGGLTRVFDTALQHHMFHLTFDGALYHCPAGKEGPPLRRVLDGGTGTGLWAIEFADAHPETHVVGFDLSPIQPSFVPPNLTFYIEDLEEDWSSEEPFDFIYCRMLTGGLTDWPGFMRRAFDNLSPGGWLELTDVVLPALSDDGTLPADSGPARWCELAIRAGHILGHSVEEGRRFVHMMRAAGFVRICERVYKWPLSPWPRDPKYKEIGLWSQHNFCSNIYGLSVALFTRAFGWTLDQLEDFLVDVEKDFKKRSIHAYWPIYVVYGQKPE
ncbi:hypothetical protein VTH06DRAFT_5820 [Thermothelomyces fergusii]